MTKRNAAYKDANFRRCNSHQLTKEGQRIPTVIYSYESKSKLYDVVLAETGQFICRTNSRVTLPSAAHHEIDKFFNLGLPLLETK